MQTDNSAVRGVGADGVEHIARRNDRVGGSPWVVTLPNGDVIGFGQTAQSALRDAKRTMERRRKLGHA